MLDPFKSLVEENTRLHAQCRELQSERERLLESLARAVLETSRAVLKERERCANLCEDTQQEYEQYTGSPMALNYSCADAIRNSK